AISMAWIFTTKSGGIWTPTPHPLLHQGMQLGVVLAHPVQHGPRQHAFERSTATARWALCQDNAPAASHHSRSCSPGQSVRSCTTVTGASNRGVELAHR